MADNELMLTTGLKVCTLTPVERQTALGMYGGQQVITRGKPYWVMRCEYANLLDEDWAALTAWVARRRGASSPFYGFPAMRRSPINGATGVTVSSVNTSLGRANFSPSGGGAFVPGDFVAYDSGSGRALVQLIENTAGSTWETFPPATAGGANADCTDPAASFRLIPQSVRMSEPFDPRKTLSFEARYVEP